MKKRNILILHSLYWAYIIGWRALLGPVITKDGNPNFSALFNPLSLSTLLLPMLIFYINYLLILPKYFKTKQYVKASFAWLALFILWVAIRYCVEEIFFLKWFGISNYSDGTSTMYYIYDNFYWWVTPAIMSFFFWLINDIIKTEKEKTQLMIEKTNAEVSFLRSQINPHFIFNTLNNIYSLVYHQSSKSLPAIEKLSSIMRYVMKEGNIDKIDLCKEIDYLQNFIELQNLRYETNIYVNFSYEGNPQGKFIAPLLMIPFVENGYKHGNLSHKKNPFTINIKILENELHLYCSNAVAKGKKDENSGIGLKNVRRRLELLYPGRFQLQIHHDHEIYTSSLIIQL